MFSKKTNLVLISALVMVLTGFVVPAWAVQFKVHGDLNHRFLLGTNHAEIFRGGDKYHDIDDGGAYDNFAEIKYRFWMEVVSDEEDYKGVFATEIGGLRFGESSKMDYSGDDIQMEVRWAYFDFQLPFVAEKARMRMGLQPININPFLWKETVGAVKLAGAAGDFDYQAGWLRGYEAQVTSHEDEDLIDDQDALYVRLDFKGAPAARWGLFGLWQWNDIDDVDPSAPSSDYTLAPTNYEFKKFQGKKVGLDLFTLGVDGSAKVDSFFVKWDAMYQAGEFRNLIYQDLNGNSSAIKDYDVRAYFFHADVGMRSGKSSVTYTFWYTSGDDDPHDGDMKAFMATDIDRTDNFIIFESYLDDDYWTERHYLLDRGFIMNKVAFDYQMSSRLKVGVACMYMMTAEDLKYTAAGGQSVREDEIGWETDVYASYKLFKNVKLDIGAGYLMAGDAMDYFEVNAIQDGESDEDIWMSCMRIRFKF